jgi:hypothetical protein
MLLGGVRVVIAVGQAHATHRLLLGLPEQAALLGGGLAALAGETGDFRPALDETVVEDRG